MLPVVSTRDGCIAQVGRLESAIWERTRTHNGVALCQRRHASEHTVCHSSVSPIPLLIKAPSGWQYDPRILTRWISPEERCHRRRETRALHPGKIEEGKVRSVLTLTQHTELHLNILNIYSYHRCGGPRNVSRLPHSPTTLQESSLTVGQ